MNTNTPQHIALIMDGNRRWATNKHLPKIAGHTAGAKNIKTIAQTAIKHNIPYITLYTLSTENLKRSEEELSHLFGLIEQLANYLGDLTKHDVKLQTIGDLSLIPNAPREKLKQVTEQTKNNKTLTLTLAIAYGGRNEIIRATQKLLQNPELQNDPTKLTEELFQNVLDTHNMPDVDLMIRTGGNTRLSNYLPWQTTYAELYFTDTFWPAFDETQFETAIDWFNEQKRNFGK